MITLEQAKQLKRGDVLYHTVNINSDGSAQRWRVNGKIATWKRNPERVMIPLKNGLYNHFSLSQDDLHLVMLWDKSKPVVMADVKEKVHADTYSVRNGVFTLRWSFYYAHRVTANDKEIKVINAFPDKKVTIVESGEVNKPFRDGASIVNSSHWFVKFTVENKENK